uniref:Uncharacterized protein n=1 Tax=Anguilla anguilla TaxID=7936 RepID=A0A0E9RNG8_ANGAN
MVLTVHSLPPTVVQNCSVLFFCLYITFFPRFISAMLNVI